MDADAILNIENEKNKIMQIENEIVNLMNGGNYDVRLMTNLGNMYKEVDDFSSMIKWYKLATKYGDPCAMNLLGIYYFYKHDYENMMIEYLNAIELNYKPSIFNLKTYYTKIKQVPNDIAYKYKMQEKYDVMIILFKISAELNDIDAIYELVMYYHDQKKYNDMIEYCCMMLAYKNIDISNFTKIKPKMIEYCRKITNMLTEYFSQENNKTLIYEIAKKQKDNKARVSLCLIGESLDNVDSIMELAIHCEKEKDYENMLGYSQKALEKGSDVALEFLENYYIKNNDKISMYSLATYYKNQQNHELMLKCLQLPIKQKNAEAICDIGDYYYEQQKYELALKYYQMGIKLNHNGCMFKMGKHYEIINNYNLMLKYKLLAIENGNDDALTSLETYCINIKNNKILYDLAISYRNQGNYEIMRKLLLKTIKSQPRDSIHALTKCYELIGDFNKMTDNCVMCINTFKCSECMYQLGKHYYDRRNYKKMLEYYSMYANTTEIHKIYEIVNICKKKLGIIEFALLYDVCLNILDTEQRNNCSICLDGDGHFETICCNQYIHCTCFSNCKTCPFCRSNKVF